MIKPVTFNNRGQRLVGVLHLPDILSGDRKAPGIAMFHGFTGNKTEAHRFFVHVARSLCDSGFVVLRFDFRGSGDSDGEFEDMTLPGEVDDAKKALSFLARQRWVVGAKIGVLGLSMGGRVAAILASEDKRVRFVVLYSAALGPLKERFQSRLSEEDWRRLNSGEAVKEANGWYLKKAFYETIDYTIPHDVMNRIEAPILIIHGDVDQVVSIEGAQKGYEIVKSLNKKNEFYTIKGGDHTFSEKAHTQAVINKTVNWLFTLPSAGRD